MNINGHIVDLETPEIDITHAESGGWFWCAGDRRHDVSGELWSPIISEGWSFTRLGARHAGRKAIRRQRRHERLSRKNGSVT